MDIQRKDAGKKRLIRRLIVGVILIGALVAAGLGVSRLKPAPPSVDLSAQWPGTVQRGPMTRDVHGLGTLVPEETMLIPATTEGRVQRILIRPGTPVKADSVIMILTSQELETDLLNAEYATKAAEADYENLKVTLQKLNLDMQSTVAQVDADRSTAKLQADRDAFLAKEGLFSEVDAKISAVKAQQLGSRLELEQKRISINSSAEQAQLAAAKVKVDQLRGQYNLKKSQVEQLKVRAGFDGMLQQLPTPVEEGQKVAAGTPLGKVAQPSKLKAELKIAETQVKDVSIGQRATIDTRNGVIEGRVSRIDPSILNGTVTVDVALIVGKDGLPRAPAPISAWMAPSNSNASATSSTSAAPSSASRIAPSRSSSSSPMASTPIKSKSSSAAPPSAPSKSRMDSRSATASYSLTCPRMTRIPASS